MPASLGVAECRRFIRAVSEKAKEMGVPVSVALVGPEGHLIALERMDGAGWITPETSWAKAFTMAAFRSMSPRFQDGLVTQHWLRERNPQLAVNAAVFTGGKVFISGGAAPVFKGNAMVGAYGISGGTSDQDEVMGRHAREKLGWRHLPEKDDTPQEVKDHINAIYEKVGLGARKLG
ncbi:GlcG/HbpS family heme-binding protein [Falsiroseomonas sp.]|uniref:GlcG/HbpS family heme-binding protein n=1 Tax=Falsiroseomonas sp. TaxID=2870721 RepID=UPI003568E898